MTATILSIFTRAGAPPPALSYALRRRSGQCRASSRHADAACAADLRHLSPLAPLQPGKAQPHPFVLFHLPNQIQSLERIDDSIARLKRVVGDKVKVEDSGKYAGLDAYQKVVDSGVDVVLLATPPGFRPHHLKYCIDAGKHVFCEKPIAVDAPGVRSVLETAEKAKQKNLSLVAGFCWR